MKDLKITKEKVYAVEYAGFIFIQVGKKYGDRNLLDFEQVGEEQATANAALFLDAISIANETGKMPQELLNERNELLEALKELHSQTLYAIDENDSRAGYTHKPSALFDKVDGLISKIESNE